ncbi:MAG: DUF429 domain-containing protein [Rubricoccaceae bacterium]|nr:DUF429 domain-containing protein [Rubricoccaceae bacterium]
MPTLPLALPPPAPVAGADGCRSGWAVVRIEPDGSAALRLVSRLADALDPDLATLAVDIPVGLLDRARRGGRLCDQAARARLPGKASSVFSPPSRAALAAETHAEASALNRAGGPDAPGLSIQAFGIVPKLREADALVTPALQEARRVVEAHPEVAFAKLNGGRPALEKKKRTAGKEIRYGLLVQAGFRSEDLDAALGAHRKRDVPTDDILDAFACAWTAARVAAGTACRLPSDDPPRDGRGLRMEIWV